MCCRSQSFSMIRVKRIKRRSTYFEVFSLGGSPHDRIRASGLSAHAADRRVQDLIAVTLIDPLLAVVVAPASMTNATTKGRPSVLGGICSERASLGKAAPCKIQGD
jgi:hypothetical protein